MAKNFSKTQETSAIDQMMQKHLSNNVEFSIGDKQYFIKKWKNSEVMDRLPLIGNLFYVPMALGAETDEFGEQDFDYGITVGTLFQRLQDQDVVAFMRDMLSCVYLNGPQEKQVDLDEDFADAGEVCVAISEVLRNHFLFLHSKDFQNLLMLGMGTANMGTTLSQA